MVLNGKNGATRFHRGGHQPNTEQQKKHYNKNQRQNQDDPAQVQTYHCSHHSFAALTWKYSVDII